MIKSYLVDTFNNREAALAIYFFLFMIWVLKQNKTRKSLFRFLKTLADKSILLSILSLLVYVSIAIYSLYSIGFWNLTMTKDTIYWTFGIGFIILMNSNKAIIEDNYFKKIIRDNIKVTMVLEFIVGLYVFGFITELILMPIMILLSFVLVFSENKKEYSQVTNLLQGVLGIIGLVYLIYSANKIYQDFNEFATFETLKSFLFPIIITIIFLPFAYFYALYLHYESLFVRVSSSLRGDRVLSRYAKRRILISVNISLSRLKKINPGFLFYDCKTKRDIRHEIKSKLIGNKKHMF